MNIGRRLSIAATLASRFLDLSPDERTVLLGQPETDWLPMFGARELSVALAQARTLVWLLEQAELAWVEASRERDQIH